MTNITPPPLPEGPTPESQRTLKDKFKRAAQYARPFLLFLWPFKIWQTLKFIAPQLAALTLAIGAQQAFQYSSGFLLPTGEDYLKKQGVNPDVAAQLSDRNIRVRERTAAGDFHSVNDMPTFLGMGYMLLNLSMEENAYHPRGFSGIQAVFGRTYVTLQADDVTARRSLSFLAGIPAESFEKIPLTDKECRLTVAFHEFRHTDRANIKDRMIVEAESDADFHAITIAEQEFDNPELAKAWMYARALSIAANNDHDTCLYLDAKLAGKRVPVGEKIEEASKDAYNLARLYISNSVSKLDKRDQHIILVDAFRAVLRDHSAMVSPLAKRRMELYIEAAEYYFPEAVKKHCREPAAVTAQPAPALCF